MILKSSYYVIIVEVATQLTYDNFHYFLRQDKTAIPGSFDEKLQMRKTLKTN